MVKNDHILGYQKISPAFIYLWNRNMLNRWWGYFLELHTMINYNIYIIYILMQKGSKSGCYTVPPNRLLKAAKITCFRTPELVH